MYHRSLGIFTAPNVRNVRAWVQQQLLEPWLKLRSNHRRKVYLVCLAIAVVGLVSRLRTQQMKKMRGYIQDAWFIGWSIPCTIVQTLLRRCMYGPLFPEWTMSFEVLQKILNRVGHDIGERLIYPHENASTIRKHFDTLAQPVAWFSMYSFDVCIQVIYLDKRRLRCEWIHPATTCDQLTTSHEDANAANVGASRRYTTHFGVHAWPVTQSPSYVLFYLHGGGYCFFSPTVYIPMMCRMRASIQKHLVKIDPTANVLVFSVDYRKAPEHVYPAPLEDALAAYDYLIQRQGVDPNYIILAGDSAGGGLVLTTLLWIKKTNRPMPVAAMVLSPYVELDVYDPDLGCDIIVSRQAEAVRNAYLPQGFEDHVEAAPLRNDLRGLPPLMIQVGDKDFLYRQSLRLATLAHAHGIHTVLDVHKNMPHVFTFFASHLIPRAARGMDNLGKFAAFHFTKHHETHLSSSSSSSLSSSKVKVKEKEQMGMQMRMQMGRKMGRKEERRTLVSGQGRSLFPRVSASKRNQSSMDLGRLDCFHPPEYLDTCDDEEDDDYANSNGIVVDEYTMRRSSSDVKMSTHEQQMQMQQQQKQQQQQQQQQRTDDNSRLKKCLVQDDVKQDVNKKSKS